MTKQEYETYKAAVERNLKHLDFVSTGACAGCEDCGLDHVHTAHARELAEEPYFSWRACDSCGSRLGGSRYPAHGRDKNNEINHFSVCTDCIFRRRNSWPHAKRFWRT